MNDYIIPPGEPAGWTQEQLDQACENIEARAKAEKSKVKKRIRKTVRPRFVDEWGLEELMTKRRTL